MIAYSTQAYAAQWHSRTGAAIAVTSSSSVCVKISVKRNTQHLSRCQIRSPSSPSLVPVLLIIIPLRLSSHPRHHPIPSSPSFNAPTQTVTYKPPTTPPLPALSLSLTKRHPQLLLPALNPLPHLNSELQPQFRDPLLSPTCPFHSSNLKLPCFQPDQSQTSQLLSALLSNSNFSPPLFSFAISPILLFNLP